MNIAALLSRASTLWPVRDAWRWGTASATYPALRDRVQRLASGLRATGLDAGDRVILFLPNSPAMLELLWATFWAGLVAVPVNRHLSPHELAYIARHSGARLIVGAAGVDPLAEDRPTLRFIDVDSPAFADLASYDPRPMAAVAGDDPAWLFYTSGTTGSPKGATLTHRNLWTMTLSYYADVDGSDGPLVHLHAAPLSHGSGLYLLPAVGRGAVNVISSTSTFDADDYLALIERHRVTHGTFLAPTMLRRLVQAVRTDPSRDLSSLGSLVVGGAALLPADLDDAIGTFGPIITTMYGQGESPMTIAVMPPGLVPVDPHDPRRGSCGRPFTSVQISITDASGRSLPPGETGEISVRGDTVMRGYWDDQCASAATLVDGWLRTGDVGHIDEAGFLFVTDRSKDVIISGGSNIYPREVEEVLVAHPDVLEVAVIGTPDPEWGESVTAFVVARPGAQVTAETLIALCRARIASFKKPRTVIFLDDLPKNPNGKVLKRVLRERAENEASPSVSTVTALPHTAR